MTMELRQALKSIRGFKSLSDSVLDQLVPFAAIRMMRAGETIFCQGEPSPYCFGILTGEVVIQRVSKDIRFPPKILGVLSSGDIFGESSIFEESPRVAMASGSKDGKLVTIRGSLLREWMNKNAAAGQPLLLSLLQASLARLHRTSHELSVIYGVGRLLGSEKPFIDQISVTLEFLKGSLAGLDDLAFYQRNPYWEEFSSLLSFPALADLPAIPVENELVQKANSTGTAQIFDPKAIQSHLEAFQLPWLKRAAIAIVPLFDWDKDRNPLQGLLCIASQQEPDIFSAEKQLLLTSVSHPLAEALSRYGRQEDSLAQMRLQKSKKSFPL